MRRSKMFSVRLVIIILLTLNISWAQMQPADIQEYSLEDLLSMEISTAAKYELRQDETPATVTIITSEDIHRYGYRTLDEVLNSVRGFYLSYDRNYSYVGVRGFGRPTDYNNRLLLLLNGHTLNERISGSASVGTDLALSLNSVERIEIVRGPGSSLYGTSAMFAVVNIITRTGIQIDGLRLSPEAGSYGYFSSALSWGREFKNGLDLSLSGIWADVDGQDLYYKEFDTPADNNGLVTGLDWDRYYSCHASLNYHGLSLAGLMSYRRKGVPTASWQMQFNDPEAQTRDQRAFLELKYQKNLTEKAKFMIRGFYDRYNFLATYPYADQPNWFEKAKNHWLGGEVQFLCDLRPNNRIVFGLESQNYFQASHRYYSADQVLFNGNFPNQVVSIYAQNAYQLTDIFAIILGLRWDQYSAFGSAVTPRIALVHNPFRTSTLKIIYGEAFRVPNVYEARYEEPEFWQANPELKPEQIKTTEIAWEQRLNSDIWTSISYYHNKIDDLIDTAELSDSMFQYQNISRVKAHGLEFELNARLKSGLHGYFSYSHQLTKDAILNARLSNSPAQVVKIGLSHKLGKALYAAVEMMAENERITVYQTQTSPYILTNLNISSQKLLDHFKLALKVRNLFDVAYALPGGFEHLQPAIAQNGRNYILKLEYRN